MGNYLSANNMVAGTNIYKTKNSFPDKRKNFFKKSKIEELFCFQEVLNVIVVNDFFFKVISTGFR